MPAGEVVVALRGVRKDYHGLRPLRVNRLDLRDGQTVALLGCDRAAAEVLVNLITAATLPDEGDIDVFGSSTREVTNPDAWFHLLDRFGILSERVVLVDELTVEQNLTLPLSFEFEGTPPEIGRQVQQVAGEIGITADQMRQSPASTSASTRMRLRLGKALALNPRVLLAEHPNAALPPEEVARLAADMSAIAARRGLAMLVLTSDPAFARVTCQSVLTLRPATGDLSAASRWRWLTRHT